MKRFIIILFLLNATILFAQKKDSVPTTGPSGSTLAEEKINDEIIIPEKPKAKSDKATGEVLTIVEKMPVFPGGYDKMNEYIQKKIKYPKNVTPGISYVTFVITRQGEVERVNILRGIKDCPACDKAALKVVEGMPNWIPGEQGGRKVNVQFNLPIKFK